MNHWRWKPKAIVKTLLRPQAAPGRFAEAMPELETLASRRFFRSRAEHCDQSFAWCAVLYCASVPELQPVRVVSVDLTAEAGLQTSPASRITLCVYSTLVHRAMF